MIRLDFSESSDCPPAGEMTKVQSASQEAPTREVSMCGALSTKSATSLVGHFFAFPPVVKRG